MLREIKEKYFDNGLNHSTVDDYYKVALIMGRHPPKTLIEMNGMVQYHSGSL